MSELELKSYRKELNDDLSSPTSLLNNPEYIDNIAFDERFEGVFPQNMPLGASKVATGTTADGGRVYQASVDGIFSFGDGSDGAATISGGTTLTSDKFYTNLIVNSGITLNPAGYRIFCQDTLRLQGTIARNGNAGSNSTGQTGGDGGVAVVDGYLRGSVVGGDGGTGGNSPNPPTVGSDGTAVSASLGANGKGGGGGGSPSGAGGGSGGAATAASVALRASWHLTQMLDVGSGGTTAKYYGSASSAGGGGGGSNNAQATGGGGGGGGTAGPVVAIYARKLIIESSGVIQSAGGNGGNGGNATATAGDAGGGGGGGAGNGGLIVLVYNQLNNLGAINVPGGTGGSPGNGAGAGGTGTAGTNGDAGSIYYFQVTL